MNCPIVTKGGSTGFAPIHVKTVAVTANVQNSDFFTGENFFLKIGFLKHSTKSTKIESTIATTPPSFEGIDRRMA